MDDYDFSLLEHPEDTKLRLIVSGDWKDAARIKQAEYSKHWGRLKRNGIVAGRAELMACHHQAWWKVQEKFPPEPTTSLCEASEFELWYDQAVATRKAQYERRLPLDVPNLTKEAIARFDKIGASTDLLSEVLWVNQVLDDRDVDAMTCPSRGAWSLLTQARKDRDWFYQNHHKPAVAMVQKRAQSDGDYRQSTTEKRACADIREMIQVAVEESRSVA